MTESRINRDNYITISGWMVTELELKGNELIVYAMIYGFSQAENQTFDGSLSYICEWLKASRPTVVTALKSLVEKGLIAKSEHIVSGVKTCRYKAVKNTAAPVAPQPPAEQPAEDAAIYGEIISYLNSKTGRKFDAKNRETRKHIHARLAEGRTLEDFKRVIDTKCAEWKNTKMAAYLRPATLFSPKFESYLNQAPIAEKAAAAPCDNPAQTVNINNIF